MIFSPDWADYPLGKPLQFWTELRCGLQGTCLLTMQSGNEGITDVQWSPDSATLFAAGTSSGRVDLWDLQVSITQPVATFHIPGWSLLSMPAVSCCSFDNVCLASVGGCLKQRLWNFGQVWLDNESYRWDVQSHTVRSHRKTAATAALGRTGMYTTQSLWQEKWRGKNVMAKA